MARLIPKCSVDDIKLKPERDVARALVEQLPHDCIVYHSYPWLKPDRNDKSGKDVLKEGEADFIIVLPAIGVLVLEVKGGIVSYNSSDHTWFREKSDGKKEQLRKDPFRQASGNMHCLVNKVRKDSFLGQADLPFAYGYCVVFPDCNYAGPMPPGADNAVVLTASDLEFLGRRIPDALKKWSRIDPPKPLTGTEFNGVVSALSPSFNLIPVLFRRIEDQDERLFRMTEDQSRVLDYIQKHKRVAIEGVAGSGKTLLAKAQAQRFARQGLRTLLLCYNKALAQWLDSSVPEQFDGYITVKHFHGLCNEFCLKHGITFNVPAENREVFWRAKAPELFYDAIGLSTDRYDAVVIDEGQDFLPNWWLPVEMLQKDENGPFYLFFDPAQNLYAGEQFTIPDLGEPICLPTNCRNTKKIAETCGRIGGFSIPVRDIAPTGDATVIEVAAAGNGQAALCEKIVQEWTGRGGLKPSQVAILDPHNLHNSSLRGRKSMAGVNLTDNLDLWADNKGILFSTIRSFKGLEADAIVILDVPVPGSLQYFNRSDLYVAASRAKHLLVVVALDERVKDFLT